MLASWASRCCRWMSTGPVLTIGWSRWGAPEPGRWARGRWAAGAQRGSGAAYGIRLALSEVKGIGEEEVASIVASQALRGVAGLLVPLRGESTDGGGTDRDRRVRFRLRAGGWGGWPGSPAATCCFRQLTSIGSLASADVPVAAARPWPPRSTRWRRLERSPGQQRAHSGSLTCSSRWSSWTLQPSS